MDAHAIRVADYYDQNTEIFYLRTWDAHDIHFGLFAPGDHDRSRALKAMTRSVVEPASVSNRDRVVDAGCGIGTAALELASSTGCAATGVNMSDVQLGIARARSVAQGWSDRVRFVADDCSVRLPFADESVDVVVSIEAACHFSDKRRFVSECVRILRPGGRFVASDWLRTDRVSPSGTRILDQVVEAWKLAGLNSLGEWLQLLATAGFTIEHSADYGDAVLENPRLLRRAHMDLMLEQANGCHTPEAIDAWSRQYTSLVQAWFGGHFTLGRWFATKR